MPSLKKVWIAIPILLITVLFACQTTAPEAPFIQDKPALDSILDHYVNNGLYPFIYARLEDVDGKVLYEHGVVNESLLPNTEVTGDTWIRIWSMSKIVTISLALDLIEEGKLALEDPVTKYIPEFKDLQVAVGPDGSNLAKVDWGERDSNCPVEFVPNDSVMTVLHLINHQAGFYYATTGFPCLDTLLALQNLPKAKDSQDLIDRMAQLPLIMAPGTADFYGTNTTVLGLVAERATGKSLRELVLERVTGPMSIEGLQYGLPPNTNLFPKFTARDSMLRVAERGELDIFGPDVPDYDPEHPLYLGGEGMLATADGYADFVRMLVKHGTLNGYRFLEETTVKDIYAPHSQLDSPYGYNGYNLWISGDSMRIKGHGDAGLWIGGGYESTHFWADPQRQFVGVIMSQNNEIQPPGHDMNDQFRGALYKQLGVVE